ncbi:MAG: DegT/DnrJ/EryC1/StrS family aminotransferase [Terracidiphilus sp.]|jgi:dTDP-4-amino-4,6-dideoxygalactose transaminase
MSDTLSATTSIAQMLPGAFFAAYRDEVRAALMRVVDSGWYILGEEVRQFEEEFADQFGYASAAGVANGTDALALALRALGVGPGDRVATVSHTAVATVAAIEMVGASPVLLEITPDTFTLDPASLARTLEFTGPLKAVIPVHLYGHPADMPAINAIARAHGMFVVEDCSQAHGARLDGQSVGNMGDIGTFSFYPTKNLGALGDGGMVVSRDAALMQRVRSLREYGWVQRYVSCVPGVNSRLDELQAAVLRVRLPYLDSANQRRRSIAAAYAAGLADTGLVLPIAHGAACHVYHQFVLRHSRRERLLEGLKKQGIGTNIHYPVPVHRQPAYASRCAIDPIGLKLTDKVAQEVFSLPMYPELSDAEVSAVILALRRLLQ